jgi:2-amino-4-hydroxy-6-hydroxymethyldihydropteridine diphosphokinase
MKHHTVYLSVGSNMGDKIDNCQRGIDTLTATARTRMVKQSPFYRTEPIGFEDQDWFVNGVFCIQTDMGPEALLEEIKAIQAKAGRKPSRVRNGPRILDLDILFYDDLKLQAHDLVIPHPRMHERRFVLQPICDINPGMVHPEFKLDMKTLLGRLPEKTQQVERIP